MTQRDGRGKGNNLAMLKRTWILLFNPSLFRWFFQMMYKKTQLWHFHSHSFYMYANVTYSCKTFLVYNIHRYAEKKPDIIIVFLNWSSEHYNVKHRFPKHQTDFIFTLYYYNVHKLLFNLCASNTRQPKVAF